MLRSEDIKNSIGRKNTWPLSKDGSRSFVLVDSQLLLHIELDDAYIKWGEIRSTKYGHVYVPSYKQTQEYVSEDGGFHYSETLRVIIKILNEKDGGKKVADAENIPDCLVDWSQEYLVQCEPGQETPIGASTSPLAEGLFPSYSQTCESRNIRREVTTAKFAILLEKELISRGFDTRRARNRNFRYLEKVALKESANAA